MIVFVQTTKYGPDAPECENDHRGRGWFTVGEAGEITPDLAGPQHSAVVAVHHLAARLHEGLVNGPAATSPEVGIAQACGPWVVTY